MLIVEGYVILTKRITKKIGQSFKNICFKAMESRKVNRNLREKDEEDRNPDK